MANAFSFKEVTTKTMKITGMVDTDAMTLEMITRIYMGMPYVEIMEIQQ